MEDLGKLKELESQRNSLEQSCRGAPGLASSQCSAIQSKPAVFTVCIRSAVKAICAPFQEAKSRFSLALLSFRCKYRRQPLIKAKWCALETKAVEKAKKQQKCNVARTQYASKVQSSAEQCNNDNDVKSCNRHLRFSRVEWFIAFKSQCPVGETECSEAHNLWSERKAAYKVNVNCLQFEEPYLFSVCNETESRVIAEMDKSLQDTCRQNTLWNSVLAHYRLLKDAVTECDAASQRSEVDCMSQDDESARAVCKFSMTIAACNKEGTRWRGFRLAKANYECQVKGGFFCSVAKQLEAIDEKWKNCHAVRNSVEDWRQGEENKCALVQGDKVAWEKCNQVLSLGVAEKAVKVQKACSELTSDDSSELTSLLGGISSGNTSNSAATTEASIDSLKAKAELEKMETLSSDRCSSSVAKRLATAQAFKECAEAHAAEIAGCANENGAAAQGMCRAGVLGTSCGREHSERLLAKSACLRHLCEFGQTEYIRSRNCRKLRRVNSLAVLQTKYGLYKNAFESCRAATAQAVKSCPLNDESCIERTEFLLCSDYYTAKREYSLRFFKHNCEHGSEFAKLYWCPKQAEFEQYLSNLQHRDQLANEVDQAKQVLTQTEAACEQEKAAGPAATACVQLEQIELTFALANAHMQCEVGNTARSRLRGCKTEKKLRASFETDRLYQQQCASEQAQGKAPGSACVRAKEFHDMALSYMRAWRLHASCKAAKMRAEASCSSQFPQDATAQKSCQQSATAAVCKQSRDSDIASKTRMLAFNCKHKQSSTSRIFWCDKNARFLVYLAKRESCMKAEDKRAAANARALDFSSCSQLLVVKQGETAMETASRTASLQECQQSVQKKAARETATLTEEVNRVCTAMRMADLQACKKTRSYLSRQLADKFVQCDAQFEGHSQEHEECTSEVRKLGTEYQVQVDKICQRPSEWNEVRKLKLESAALMQSCVSNDAAKKQCQGQVDSALTVCTLKARSKLCSSARVAELKYQGARAEFKCKFSESELEKAEYCRRQSIIVKLESSLEQCSKAKRHYLKKLQKGALKCDGLVGQASQDACVARYSGRLGVWYSKYIQGCLALRNIRASSSLANHLVRGEPRSLERPLTCKNKSPAATACRGDNGCISIVMKLVCSPAADMQSQQQLLQAQTSCQQGTSQQERIEGCAEWKKLLSQRTTEEAARQQVADSAECKSARAGLEAAKQRLSDCSKSGTELMQRRCSEDAQRGVAFAEDLETEKCSVPMELNDNDSIAQADQVQALKSEFVANGGNKAVSVDCGAARSSYKAAFEAARVASSVCSSVYKETISNGDADCQKQSDVASCHTQLLANATEQRDRCQTNAQASVAPLLQRQEEACAADEARAAQQAESSCDSLKKAVNEAKLANQHAAAICPESSDPSVAKACKDFLSAALKNSRKAYRQCKDGASPNVAASLV